MLKNKCYITGNYTRHTGDFIIATIKNNEQGIYIGNFKNTDKIIAKLERDITFNAICRIRRVYEPEYPEINKRFPLTLNTPLNKDYLWFEAIKLQTFRPGPLCDKLPSGKGYFELEDTYKNIFAYLPTNGSFPAVSEKNAHRIVTIHGSLERAGLLNAYRILSVKPLDEFDHIIPISNDRLEQKPVPKELKKFNLVP